MRDTFEGRETEAVYGQSTRGGDLSESSISQIVGGHTEYGHGLLVMDFCFRSGLAAAAREAVNEWKWEWPSFKAFEIAIKP